MNLRGNGFGVPPPGGPDRLKPGLRTRGSWPGNKPATSAPSFTNYFHQHTLSAAAIELAVKDLFPRPEVRFAFGDGNDHFPTHDLAFQVGVGVVFTGAIVLILRSRLVRRELLQPDIIIVQKPILGVVDEHRCCNVHRAYETESILHTTLFYQSLNRV